MSDNNTNNQEPDINPDSVYTEDQKPQSKPKKKRSKVLLVGGLFIVGAVAYSLVASTDTSTTSTVVAPPSLNTTSGGTIQDSSPEYAESLRRANDQNAERALEEGRTFIATPEGSLSPLNPTVESLPQPVVEDVKEPETDAVVTRKRPVIAQLRKTNEAPAGTAQADQGQTQGQGQQPENPYVGLISGQMSTIGKAYGPKESGGQIFKTTQTEPKKEATTPTAQSNTLSSLDEEETAEQDTPALTKEELAARRQAEISAQENVLKEPVREDEKVYVAAGDVLYGEVVATVNSDAQMPVIVQVTTGEHKGARLLGTFSTDNVSGKLVVSFSQMTNGNVTVPVSALAIDGYSADTTVRSGIEKRYLKRYGTVFATTFIEGVASGLAEPKKTVLTDQNGNNQVVADKRTTDESLWNGVSAAVGVINEDIMAGRPKGPKIYLHSGYPVGVLFVDDLRENPFENDRTP